MFEIIGMDERTPRIAQRSTRGVTGDVSPASIYEIDGTISMRGKYDRRKDIGGDAPRFEVDSSLDHTLAVCDPRRCHLSYVVHVMPMRGNRELEKRFGLTNIG